MRSTFLIASMLVALHNGSTNAAPTRSGPTRASPTKSPTPSPTPEPTRVPTASPTLIPVGSTQAPTFAASTSTGSADGYQNTGANCDGDCKHDNAGDGPKFAEDDTNEKGNNRRGGNNAENNCITPLPLNKQGFVPQYWNNKIWTSSYTFASGKTFTPAQNPLVGPETWRTSLPGGQLRCCATEYKINQGNSDTGVGRCDTSSCVENWGLKNLNCFNYGSPQFKTTWVAKDEAAPNRPGRVAYPAGSNICPYDRRDKAICDTSYYTFLNGKNCRAQPKSVHCLGKVKCNTVGIIPMELKDQGRAHSSGTAAYQPGADHTTGCRNSVFPEGADCFYDGTSENWKVCGNGGIDCDASNAPKVALPPIIDVASEWEDLTTFPVTVTSAAPSGFESIEVWVEGIPDGVILSEGERITQGQYHGRWYLTEGDLSTSITVSKANGDVIDEAFYVRVYARATNLCSGKKADSQACLNVDPWHVNECCNCPALFHTEDPPSSSSR